MTPNEASNEITCFHWQEELRMQAVFRQMLSRVGTARTRPFRHCQVAVAILMAAIVSVASGVAFAQENEADQVALKWLECLNGGTADDFRALFADDTDSKLMVAAVYELHFAQRRFRDKLIKAYGAKAFDEFQDISRKGDGHSGSGIVFTLVADNADEEGRDLEEIPTETSESLRHYAYDNWNSEDQLFLRQVNGKWFIALETFVPIKSTPEKQAAAAREVAKLINAHYVAIGQQGVSWQDIDEELGVAFQEMFFTKKVDRTPRYNLDKWSTD